MIPLVCTIKKTKTQTITLIIDHRDLQKSLPDKYKFVHRSINIMNYEMQNYQLRILQAHFYDVIRLPLIV